MKRGRRAIFSIFVLIVQYRTFHKRPDKFSHLTPKPWERLQNPGSTPKPWEHFQNPESSPPSLLHAPNCILQLMLVVRISSSLNLLQTTNFLYDRLWTPWSLLGQSLKTAIYGFIGSSKIIICHIKLKMCTCICVFGEKSNNNLYFLYLFSPCNPNVCSHLLTILIVRNKLQTEKSFYVLYLSANTWLLDYKWTAMHIRTHRWTHVDVTLDCF